MDFLHKKVEEKIYYCSGKDFQDKSYDFLKCIYGDSIVQIYPNVEGSGSGDGGIDFYDPQSETWFSVYGQEHLNKKIKYALNSKIGSDLQKVMDDTIGCNPKNWIFVCNRQLGSASVTEIAKKKGAKSFKIKSPLDLTEITKKLLKTQEGKEHLFSLGFINEHDLVLTCSTKTINELKDQSRSNTNVEIKNHQSRSSVKDKVSTKINEDDLYIMEDLRYQYLKNYIPILLDGGIFSRKLPQIERKYRENINSDLRGISKEYETFERYEEFIYQNTQKNESTFKLIDKENLVHELLLNSENSRKGCFYEQVINGFYDFETISISNIKLKILSYD